MSDRFVACMRRRPVLRIEALALLISLWFTAVCNPLFWSAIVAGRPLAQGSTLLFIVAVSVTVTALHFAILVLLLNRWTAKPLLVLLIAATAMAAYYMRQYHVYLDPSMLRNVLKTDRREASELFSWSMLAPLAMVALPPLLLVWRVRLLRRPLLRASGFRLATLLLAVIAMGGSTLLVYKDFSSLMRRNKEVRYLMTPGNYLYSLARALSADATAATHAREEVGADAVLSAAGKARKKPALLVIVVGETARAANWGLSGYARQTTPELAALDVINFADVTSCGTNTEVSVPCVFSPYGRHNYDEDRIRGSESLLNVLTRAGYRVVWLDNQSGCKGVCDGLESWRPDAKTAPNFCTGDSCFDEAMLAGAKSFADRNVNDAAQNTVLVMHQLGNHGPAYSMRYPDAYKRFTPACENPDLGRCKREEIVNAYDNALLYTDHMLGETVRFLKAQETRYDTAMIYFSDHGESLGENGLFLHGIPYSIAPETQTHVPMVMWFSPGFAAADGLSLDCLRQRALQPAAHDNVFHSVLSLLDVQTSVLDRRFDLVAACRPAGN